MDLRVAATLMDFPEAAARALADEGRAIAAATGGSQSAFAELYRRHVARIYGLCLRLTGQRETAEDCVQETFINAWRGLARFEARSAFSTWLHRIAVNTVMARRRLPAAGFEVEADEASLAEARVAEDTPPLDLEAAITTLPNGTRHVLVLVGLYGYSHEEAAEALGIAVGTSKTQLHRARRMLAARLDLSPEAP
jgi:RNA polymerase sigma-70 factor (ECF subfamily)